MSSLAPSRAQGIGLPRTRLAPLRVSRNLARRVQIGVPYLWLGLFFLAPLLILLKISLAEPLLGQPPYSDLLA